MQHNLKNFITILAIVALAFAVTGKMKLCFIPDGDAHMEREYVSCDLAGECTASAEESGLSSNTVEGQSSCLDIILGGDLADSPQKNIVQLPIPSRVFLGPEVIPDLALKTSFFTISTVSLPQLVLQQSVILLI